MVHMCSICKNHSTVHSLWSSKNSKLKAIFFPITNCPLCWVLRKCCTCAHTNNKLKKFFVCLKSVYYCEYNFGENRKQRHLQSWRQLLILKSTLFIYNIMIVFACGMQIYEARGYKSQNIANKKFKQMFPQKYPIYLSSIILFIMWLV